jgi:hypothetical protein
MQTTVHGGDDVIRGDHPRSAPAPQSRRGGRASRGAGWRLDSRIAARAWSLARRDTLPALHDAAKPLTAGKSAHSRSRSATSPLETASPRCAAEVITRGHHDGVDVVSTRSASAPIAGATVKEPDRWRKVSTARAGDPHMDIDAWAKALLDERGPGRKRAAVAQACRRSRRIVELALVT